MVLHRTCTNCPISFNWVAGDSPCLSKLNPAVSQVTVEKHYTGSDRWKWYQTPCLRVGESVREVFGPKCWCIPLSCVPIQPLPPSTRRRSIRLSQSKNYADYAAFIQPNFASYSRFQNAFCTAVVLESNSGDKRTGRRMWVQLGLYNVNHLNFE